MLAGAVPLPAEWLRGWASARTFLSAGTAAKQATCKHHSSAIRGRAVARRAHTQMVSVMADCIRAEKRRRIAEADSATIALDNKGACRLTRFKVD